MLNVHKRKITFFAIFLQIECGENFCIQLLVLEISKSLQIFDPTPYTYIETYDDAWKSYELLYSLITALTLP